MLNLKRYLLGVGRYCQNLQISLLNCMYRFDCIYLKHHKKNYTKNALVKCAIIVQN